MRLGFSGAMEPELEPPSELAPLLTLDARCPKADMVARATGGQWCPEAARMFRAEALVAGARGFIIILAALIIQMLIR